jgi:hypothetical protein
MKSKKVQEMFDQMENDNWYVKLRRWWNLQIWTYKCLSRKYWDKTQSGYIFKKRNNESD